MASPETPQHPTPPRPLPVDVTRAVAALLTGGSASEMEKLVRAYVRALRAAGLPPEQALRRVKEVVGVATVTPLPVRDVRASERLADDVVAWFVAEYYRTD
jgi:hypothetical protein